ncbi:hypothetical protein ACTFIT_011133 [Dictyostelium discoideum]
MVVAGSVLKFDNTWKLDENYEEYIMVTKESEEKRKISLALIILGSMLSIIGTILLSCSFCISAAIYKNNIKTFLIEVNRHYGPRGIVWKFERELVNNYYKYYIKISFPTTIQRISNSETEVEPTLTIADNSQYYPPSSQQQQQQTSNSNRFEPNSPKPSAPPTSYSQYYPPPLQQQQQTSNSNSFEPYSPTPYYPNSDEPSSSSSSSSSPRPLTTTTTTTKTSTIKSLQPQAPLQLPHIYEEAQSVPLPQEILDMLELEERNDAKEFRKL